MIAISRIELHSSDYTYASDFLHLSLYECETKIISIYQ